MRHSMLCYRLSSFALAVFAAATAAPAQCSSSWVANSGLPTTASAVVSAATLWDPDGGGPLPEQLVVGGSFSLPAPLNGANLAVRDLATGVWSTLPGWTFGAVTAMAVLPTGDLVVAASPGSGGPSSQSVLVRWTGSAWQQLTVANERILALLVAGNGDLYAGGAFTGIANTLIVSLARWNGTAWSALGTGIGPFSSVLALAALPNGDLIAGGTFSSAGGVPTPGIARWNGSAWSSLGPGFGGLVTNLAVAPNGDLYAGGAFTGGVSRWNGSTWSAIVGSPNPAGALTVLPGGDVVASGTFGGVTAVRRYSGGSWAPFATGIAGSGAVATVIGFTMLPDGDLAVHGDFATAAGPSAGVAVLRSSCRAEVLAAGAGCASSGGANQLAATTLPWLGATFRARGSGLPALALVSIVTGLSPTQLPLAALIPAGQPGCDLLVSPDFVDVAVVANGGVDTALAVPTTSALVGLDVYQQLNPIEVTPQLAFVAVTATNALRLRLGTW